MLHLREERKHLEHLLGREYGCIPFKVAILCEKSFLEFLSLFVFIPCLCLFFNHHLAPLSFKTWYFTNLVSDHYVT